MCLAKRVFEIHTTCCIYNSSSLFIAERYSILLTYYNLLTHFPAVGHVFDLALLWTNWQQTSCTSCGHTLSSTSSTFSSVSGTLGLLNVGHSTGWETVAFCDFNLHPLVTNACKQLLMFLLVTHVSSLWWSVQVSCPFIKLGFSSHLWFAFFYFLDMSPLSGHTEITFLLAVHGLPVHFEGQKNVVLMEAPCLFPYDLRFVS